MITFLNVVYIKKIFYKARENIEMNEGLKNSRRHFLKTAGMASLSLAFPNIFTSCRNDSQLGSKPNIILIFIDDLGYGDIGPFGSQLNRTSHLDKMAAEGMKLTSFYAMPLCSPSRASLMTGCYPKRVGLEGRPSNCRFVLFPGDPNGINPLEITVAELLQIQGYATACIGKWHLGDQPEFFPTRHGFDYFYGLPYSNDMDPKTFGDRWGFSALPLIRNEKILGELKHEDQALLTKNYTEEAIEFIKKNHDRPFFLYLAHTMVHYPYAASESFKGKSQNGIFGDAVEELDWSTGEILRSLQDFGLDKQTLVIFVSDNGAAGGTAGPLRGRKGRTWEGGMRVPCIARWPGRIPSRSSCDEVASLMDFLPTFGSLAGAKVPTDRIIDGHDIWPLLSGQTGAKSPYEAFYYYRESRLQAVRSEEWKLVLPRRERVRRNTAGQDSPPKPEYMDLPLSLFNLKEDIGETTNLAEQHPGIVKELMSHVERARIDLGDGEEHPGKNCRPPGTVKNNRLLIEHENPEDSIKLLRRLYSEECEKGQHPKW
jgi:arylsulfatase A-like enzyme